jgi:hypothetical protein
MYVHETVNHLHMLQLWENLIYDIEVKNRLLRYAESALTFSDRKVSCEMYDEAGIIHMFVTVDTHSLPTLHAGRPQHHQLEPCGAVLLTCRLLAACSLNIMHRYTKRVCT